MLPIWPVVLALACLCVGVLGVDRSNFKTCGESGFCKRNRDMPGGQNKFVAIANSVVVDQSVVRFALLNVEGVNFVGELHALVDNTARLKINEKNPLHERYEVRDSLVGEPTSESLHLLEKTEQHARIQWGNKNVAVLTFDPFRVDFLYEKEVVTSLNSRGLLNFEHYREKRSAPEPADPPAEEGADHKEHHHGAEEAHNDGEETHHDGEEAHHDGEEAHHDGEKAHHDGEEAHHDGEEAPHDGEGAPHDEEGAPHDGDKDDHDNAGAAKEEKHEEAAQSDGEGAWEETFKSHTDTKPRGPSSIGLDISFPGAEHVFGIPEHADSLALKTTKGSGAHHSEPYRLYNLDVFEYELNNPMALYGSIPVMLAHSAKHSAAVFWNNAAETWIDVSSARAKAGIIGSLVSYFHGNDETPQMDTHWFSESGIIDVFVMLGPRPHDLFRQYSRLTGTTPLPPMFAIAYHQCRWNYNDEEDVASVNRGYEENDIPVDVIWLDIEHTDGKKYFTWDSAKFPTPARMQEDLWSYGRRMVTIIDPHIKREGGYHIHEEAGPKGFYVKNKDDNDYDGWCWPGSSSWIDFTSPEIRQWWASKMAYDQYTGSTKTLFTWNDMNEPSVFNGPEITMHKDAKHFGNFEHRDVHNIYGMYQHQATAEGQIARSGDHERPFVLSRAFFAGSQRFGAIWTGDNTAEWSHLKASMPMLLSIGVAGLTFSGADVGGFFKNPETELLVRWYQAGAHQPFFRAHAHLDTRRREPYLHDEYTMQLIRSAILARYALLPFWYTQYWHASRAGVPVMRPLWVEYPEDTNTFDMDDQYLIGGDLLVKPVTESGVSSWSVYLPGRDQVWFDTTDYRRYTSGQTISISVDLARIPVFQHGGSIIPKKPRVRRSSTQMLNDPYLLVVALDGQMSASGELYVDDGSTFDFKKGQYLVRKFQYAGGKLTSSNGDAAGTYQTPSWVQEVNVVGQLNEPTRVTIEHQGSSRDLTWYYNREQQQLIIRKPDVNIADDFTITLA